MKGGHESREDRTRETQSGANGGLKLRRRHEEGTEMTSCNPQTKTITKSIRYPVPSATRPEIKHTVTEDVETGARHCNCEASGHPKTRGTCWHIKAAASGLIKPVVRISQRPARPEIREALRWTASELEV